MWNATQYFNDLTHRNRLAAQHGFGYAQVSGLQGFIDALNQADAHPNMICIDDTSDGYYDLQNTPRIRQVKTVFLYMKHAPGDYDARQECLQIMQEIFRQMLTTIIRQKTQIEQGGLYLDPRIQFTEMDQYIATGAACAYFQISTDQFTHLRYNPDEWQ